MPTEPAPLPPPRGPVSGLPGALLILSLAFNVALAGWLWHTQAALGRRLARIEDLAFKGRSRVRGGPPDIAHTATRQERIAFLLAAAGNADDSKKILAAVPLDEDAEIARALIARLPANDRN